jgi:hypothetical protein
MRAKEFIREAENTNLKQELQKDWMPQGYVPPQELRGKNISLPRDEKGRPIEPGLAQPLISPEDLVLPLAGSLSRKVTQGIGGLARGATKSTSGMTSTASSAVPQTSLDLAQKAELAAKYPWQQRTKFSNLPPEGPFSQQTYQDAMRRAWQQTPPTQGPFDTFKDLVKAPKINIGDVTLPNPLGARNIGKSSMSAETLAQKEFERLYGRKGSARDLEDATKLDALRDRFVGRGYQSLPPLRTDNMLPTDLPKLDPSAVRSKPWTPEKVKRELRKQADILGQDTIPAVGVDTVRQAVDYAKNWSAANKDKQTKNQ